MARPIYCFANRSDVASDTCGRLVMDHRDSLNGPIFIGREPGRDGFGVHPVAPISGNEIHR